MTAQRHAAATVCNQGF